MRVHVCQFNTHTGINLLPLAAGLLASHAKADHEIGGGLRVTLEAERSDPVETAALLGSPDVIGYCCYMWNIQQSLAVAREVKRRHPRAVNVIGGPSAPRTVARIQECLHHHGEVDIIAIGEGEVTFTEVLRQLHGDGDLASVAGIAFRDPSDRTNIIVTPPRRRRRHLDELPSPFLDGTFDEFLATRRDRVTGVIWETNRGCPFACSFCDWGQATHNKVHEFGLERLHRELIWIARQRFDFCWASDANFGIRRRDLAIAEDVAAIRKQYGYPRFFQVSWVKNSSKHVIRLHNTLMEAGIRAPIALSVQSFDDGTLLAVNRQNIRNDAFLRLKEHFSAAGAQTYSEVILGLPEETYQSFCRGIVNGLSPVPTDFLVLYLCRVLENTEMALPESRRRFGLVTRVCRLDIPRRTGWNRTVDEFEEIVVATNAMPLHDWRRAFEFGFFACAIYNQRLAHVVLNWLRSALGVDLQHFLEFVLAAITPRLHLLCEMLDCLRAGEEEILRNGPAVRPLDGFGDYAWEPNELCYLIAARAPDQFLAEMKLLCEAYVAEHELDVPVRMMDEAFRFQSLLVPRFDGPGRSVSSFSWAWDDFCRLGRAEAVANPLSNPVQLEFLAPPIAEESQVEFLREQIRVTRSGTRTLCDVRRVRPSDRSDREANANAHTDKAVHPLGL